MNTLLLIVMMLSVNAHSLEISTWETNPPALQQGPIDSLNMRLTGIWRTGYASVTTVDTARGLLFLTSGLEVRVYDVSTPSSPVLINVLDAHDYQYDLFYDHATQRLYVLNFYDGVVDIWDFTNPMSPNLLNSFHTGYMYYSQIEVRNDTMFLTRFFDLSLLMYDVHDPTAINLLSVITFVSINHPQDFKVSGNYLYAACGNSGLQIMDFTTPSIAGTFDSLTYDLEINGNIVYLATDKGIITLDISNPSNPVQVGFLSIPVVSPRYAYLAYRNDTLFVNYRRGPFPDTFATTIKLVDVSNPSSPVLLDSMQAQYRSSEISPPYQNYLYASYNGNAACGIIVFDIGSLTATGTVDIESASAVDYAFTYPYLYIPAGPTGKLKVFDLSNPANPTIVSSLLLTNKPSYIHRIEKKGNHLYITRGLGDGALIIVNVDNPLNPYIEGVLPLPTHYAYPFGVKVSGNYAYVGDIDSLYIIDVSTPSNPQRVGSVYLPFLTPNYGGRREIAISGNYAFVTYGGFHTVDISNPGNPVLINSIYRNYDSWDVALYGNYALVAWSDSLIILDVSNPSSPVPVSSWRASYSSVIGVSVFNNFAIVAHWGSGIRVLDISNPLSPSEVGFYDWPNFAWYSGHLFGNYLISMNDADGFSIYQMYGSPTSVSEDVKTGSNNSKIKVVYTEDGVRFLTPGSGILRIIDPCGRTILRKAMDGRTGTSVSGLKTGLYLWKFEPTKGIGRIQTGKFFQVKN